MTCHHIHFVTFDRAFEFDRWLLGDDAVAQSRGHFVNLWFAHLQFRRNLAIGKVQTHQVLFGLSTNIQAKHPNGEWR